MLLALLTLALIALLLTGPLLARGTRDLVSRSRRRRRPAQGVPLRPRP